MSEKSRTDQLLEAILKELQIQNSRIAAIEEVAEKFQRRVDKAQELSETATRNMQLFSKSRL